MKKNIKFKKSYEEANTMKNIAAVTIRSILIFSAVLFAAAAVCYFSDVDYEKYYLFFIFASVISALMSGFAASRKKKKNGIINGIISVVPIAVLILAASLIITQAQVTMLLPITLICIIFAGAVAGSIGVNLGR